ncbi:enolase C-terminal domain-like protein [Blattabacterium sp. (Blattella germanica)]|uniref:enolase C-terminal domain-like protein n=1 Tax=Blattabacterium sp. (Blattella germanica) TaxID=624186 RepID=UPI0002DB04E6|nr:enolase C-terminal domain-like protein [Blattabacterium sp. (Blattella germanica)]
MEKIKFFLKKKTFFFRKKIFNSNRIFNRNTIWFIILKKNNKIGIGECNPLLEKSVSKNRFENELENLSKRVVSLKKTEVRHYHKYISYSSIFFGLEQAFLSLKNQFPVLYDSEFFHGKKGISINALIWLNSFKKKNKGSVIKEIENRIIEGFSFIKMKISANFFDYQYSVLKKIKKKYPFIKIRVDANGSFENMKKTLYCLNKLYDLSIIHSIEQPISSGYWKNMSKICKQSKLPIALDEELEGIHELKEKKRLLDIIHPEYVVLKPSINGGFYGSKEWILEANKRKIKWWISSSLESNIGLNAITQWTFMMMRKQHLKYSNVDSHVHGLNTGVLYVNNWISPLEIKEGSIWYNPSLKWKIFF